MAGCFDRQPQCDSAEAVATIKNMALERINSFEGRNLTPGFLYLSGKTKINLKDLSSEHLTLDSFRKQGEVGRTGSSCAAQVGFHALGEKLKVWEFSTQYTIEPTTDGKTMVSARFFRAN